MPVHRSFCSSESVCSPHNSTKPQEQFNPFVTNTQSRVDNKLSFHVGANQDYCRRSTGCSKGSTENPLPNICDHDFLLVISAAPEPRCDLCVLGASNNLPRRQSKYIRTTLIIQLRKTKKAELRAEHWEILRELGRFASKENLSPLILPIRRSPFGFGTN